MDKTSIALLLSHNNLTIGKLDQLQEHLGTLSKIVLLGPTYGNGVSQFSVTTAL